MTCVLPKLLLSPAARDRRVCLLGQPLSCLPRAARCSWGTLPRGLRIPLRRGAGVGALGAWEPLGCWGMPARLGFPPLAE